jgi:hypothetical protein
VQAALCKRGDALGIGSALMLRMIICRHTPKGLRTFKDENWASLRMAVTASAVAATYASIPNVTADTAVAARCLARSQLRYVAGDAGISYMVGFGKRHPQQVHHRDACCTMQEDAAGVCGGEKCASSLLTLWKVPYTCKMNMHKVVCTAVLGHAFSKHHACMHHPLYSFSL